MCLQPAQHALLGHGQPCKVLHAHSRHQQLLPGGLAAEHVLHGPRRAQLQLLQLLGLGGQARMLSVLPRVLGGAAGCWPAALVVERGAGGGWAPTSGARFQPQSQRSLEIGHDCSQGCGAPAPCQACLGSTS